MRILLVTSQITYVRDNYYSLIKNILGKGSDKEDIEFVGLVFIKTMSVSLFLKSLFLMINGVVRLSAILLFNMVRVVFNDNRSKLCKSLNIPVFLSKNINDLKTLDYIKGLEPDLIINMRTRNIYKKEILDIPRIGCINIHHGILPQNRGTMCDFWAYQENRPVGFSVHWMNEKIDDGNILTTKEISTEQAESYADIPMLSSVEEANTLLWCIDKIKQDPCFYSLKNTKENIRFTRNPTYKQIRQMIKKGRKL